MKKLLFGLLGLLFSLSVQAQIFGVTNPVLCGSDSVFQPCFTWGMNPNTGFYQPLTNRIGISIASTQVGYWDSTGYHGALFPTGILTVNLGGTGSDLSATGGASQFLRQNSVGANVSVVRPACADLSNATASCSTDTTNATNITTGNLPAAQLPGTVGDDKVLVGDSASAATWRTLPSGAVKYTTGTNTFAQAACSDLSGVAASCSTDTTNATNISSGTLSSSFGGSGLQFADAPNTDFDLTNSGGGGNVTIISKSIAPGATRQFVVMDVWLTILNNSGASRSYTFTVDYGTLSATGTVTPAHAASATNRNAYHFQATVAVSATNLTNMIVTVMDNPGAVVASGNVPPLSSGTGPNVGWATSASNLTGAQTMDLKMASPATTATQTATLNGYTFTIYPQK